MAAEGGTGVLGRMLGPYGVLRGNRNLQLLFGGQVVSSFGDWLYVLALGILAYEITGSATAALACSGCCSRGRRGRSGSPTRWCSWRRCSRACSSRP